jgi:iron complex transport system ATP-binding protein
VKIVIKGLEVWYDSIQALRDASLEINEGELTFIIGPNGAGKSTLLKTIALIIKPKVGVIYIDGKALSKFSLKELSKILAYVDYQISKSLPSTVFEFLLTARYPHQSMLMFSMSQEDLEIVDKISKQLNISHLLDRKLDQLSSGELQRVLIARAFIQGSKVLLLDEPSAFLDLKYKLEILDLVKKFTKINRSICIIAIHDLYLASLYADKVVIMSNGEIVAVGRPREIFREDLLEKVYGVKTHILDINGRIAVIPLEPLNKMEL